MSLKLSEKRTKLPTVKGICRDCIFLNQEWHLQWYEGEDGMKSLYMELDKYCRVADLFKRDDSYCDLFEEDA
jgi:hypothetical protein